jgi:hypothetical protein
VEGPGVLDVTVWRQQQSMTVHLVNFTNPMMLKGPFRELLPVGKQKLELRIPEDVNAKKVYLLAAGVEPLYEINGNQVSITIDQILDHEVIAVDF